MSGLATKASCLYKTPRKEVCKLSGLLSFTFLKERKKILNHGFELGASSGALHRPDH
jgi:hypothetical protein